MRPSHALGSLVHTAHGCRPPLPTDEARLKRVEDLLLNTSLAPQAGASWVPYTHEMRFRPLQLEHAHKCLAGCAAGLAKLDLEGDLQAAFKALGVGKGETTTMHLTHKCRLDLAQDGPPHGVRLLQTIYLA